VDVDDYEDTYTQARTHVVRGVPALADREGLHHADACTHTHTYTCTRRVSDRGKIGTIEYHPAHRNTNEDPSGVDRQARIEQHIHRENHYIINKTKNHSKDIKSNNHNKDINQTHHHNNNSHSTTQQAH
jgi:hypothetical protein